MAPNANRDVAMRGRSEHERDHGEPGDVGDQPDPESPDADDPPTAAAESVPEPTEASLFETILQEIGFHTPVGKPVEPDRGPWRTVASVALSLVGLGLLVPNATMLFTVSQSATGSVLAVVGTVISLLLTAAGYALYRSNFSDTNAVRIAAWTVLGLVLTSVVMAAVFLFQARTGGQIEVAPFTFAFLVTVGTSAHAGIGVFDARRVRAEMLALGV